MAPESTEKGSCERFVDSCDGLCTAEAWWPWNVLCCPLVLIYNSIVIYLFVCLRTILFRFWDCFCCCLCKNYCDEYYFYEDKNFPADPSSLSSREIPDKWESSTLKGLDYLGVKQKVAWCRPSEFLDEWINKHKDAKLNTEAGKEEEEQNERMQLFYKGIQPDDVVQGHLGDCWLLAAMAALSEFPESIQNVFVTKEYNPQGKYTLRLYDDYRSHLEKKDVWTYVTIDDRIPVDSEDHEPLFATPNGRELWVFLLEKAFAKYCWGYTNLSGGHALWALHVITGDIAFRVEYDEEKGDWEKLNLKYKKKWDEESDPLKKNPAERYVLTMDDDRYSDEKMWHLLLEYNKRHSVMICGKTNKGESKDDDVGIVAGHAYTLCETVEVDDLRMLQLRNPWGEFEWTGAWSDGDSKWESNPQVAKACEYENNKEDGMFWIEWSDWKKHYNNVQICHRTTKFDLHLDVREEDGCCGIVKGCVLGCGDFWCCCSGFRKIFLGERSKDETVEVTYCCGLFTKSVE